MKRIFRFACLAACAAGLAISPATGQESAIRTLPDAIARKIRIAQDTLDEVQGALETENLYVPSVEGLNPVAIMGGHRLERGDPMYASIARIARTITRAGRLMPGQGRCLLSGLLPAGVPAR